MGKDKANGRRGGKSKLGNHGFKIMAVCSQAMKPDDGRLGLDLWVDLDTVQQTVFQATFVSRSFAAILARPFFKAASSFHAALNEIPELIGFTSIAPGSPVQTTMPSIPTRGNSVRIFSARTL
jgi:hypothetical protein